MNNAGFEEAFAGRVADMLDACTKCGACFEACPIAAPAGLGEADPKAVTAGVLDIVRAGKGPDAAEKWAKACMLSGECIKACDYGVNPRFLLAVARVQMARRAAEPPDRRKAGVNGFRKLAEDVNVLSRLQLSDEALERLGQIPSRKPPAEELPEVVFYTGCNVLKTPHIALLCLDIMDRIGVSYRVMGGPTHCCGVIQFRTGDLDTSSRFAANTLSKLAASKSGQVLAWCPSCFVQFSENMIPTFERATGEKPFELAPFMRFLRGRLDDLRPHLRKAVPMRVALHRHPGVAGVAEAAEDILRAVPGVEIVKLDVPAVGLQSVNLATLPAYKRELQLKELEAARDAGVDALAAVYHSDHRELCAHERDWPFKIINVLEIVGESMGLRQEDHYKHLKVMQDADAIVKDCADLIAKHKLDPETARRVVVQGMLADQPLPLKGRALNPAKEIAPS
ncbi:MAG TPA: (Fe-S)-binding protein [Xanthobacteraceae bacterium]|nr:(Fe-S)-binding protein [Xanthobacteraceae bacterium]